LLFFVVCAVVLATIAPLAPKGPRELQELFIGTMASLGAFGLTVLFIRWEGLRPDDIGASPDRWSLLRFSLGFFIGLFLVALHSAIAWSAGHVQWVRSSETGSRDAVVTLIAYLSFQSRQTNCAGPKTDRGCAATRADGRSERISTRVFQPDCVPG